MTPKEYAKSLRLLAQLYDEVPEDFLVPYERNAFNCYLAVNSDKPVQAAEAIRITQVLGETEKEYIANSLYLKKKVGEITLQFILDREAVCTRKVVVIPAYSQPEHVKEIVEWIWPSLA